MAFTEKIVVYDACQFKERFWITGEVEWWNCSSGTVEFVQGETTV